MKVASVKSVALTAALSMAAVPAIPMAQSVCPSGQTVDATGQCTPAEEVVVQPGGTAQGPMLPGLSGIPFTTVVIGGIVVAVLTTAIIAASNNNNNAVFPATTTN